MRTDRCKTERIVARGGLCILLVSVCGCVSSSRTDRIIADLIRRHLDTPAPVAAESVTPTPLDITPALPISDSTPLASEPDDEPVVRTEITIQPESIIRISVKEDPGLDGSYEVDIHSSISFRYVGMVFLDNMTERQAEAEISKILKKRGFRTASVGVKIERASYDRVRVSGAVMQPQDLKVGPGSRITLHEALRRAKGLKTRVKGATVTVVTNGIRSPWGLEAPWAVKHNLSDENGNAKLPDITLQNNDWVHIQPGGESGAAGLGEKEIQLVGEVHQPGIVRFYGSEPCTMKYLMFKIGKLPKWANDKKVKIVRRDEDGFEEEIIVNVDKLMKEGRPEDDEELENGDRVVVPPRGLIL